MAEYEQLLRSHAVDYARINHRQFGLTELQSVFGPGVERATFANLQRFDLNGVIGRLLSSSYAPLPGHPGHEPMMADLRAVFERHAVDGAVDFLYITELYTVRL
jgi:hypothetical protein